jgi:hypothetical protein
MVWADEASVIAQGPAQVHAAGCGGFAVRSRWIGRAGRVSGSRELIVHPNYIVIYDIVGDTIRFLRL